MKISIKKKATTFFILMLIPTLLVGMLSLYQTRDVMEELKEEVIRAGNEGRVPVSQLHDLIQQAMRPAHRYMETGNPDEVFRFKVLGIRIDAHFEAILPAYLKNTKEKRLLQETLGYWIVARSMAENIFAIQSPLGQETGSQLFYVMDLMESRALLSLGHFYNVSHLEREIYLTEANLSYDQLKQRTLILTLLGLSFGLVVLFSAMRQLTRNLDRLSDGARRLGRGELEHTIMVSSGDEFESISIEFNRMGKNLRKNLETIKYVATHDGLTGLLNHMAFFKNLNKEFARCLRHHHSMTLIMLDVDYFKEFNDKYGHQMGDKALKRVAEVLKVCVRQSDLVARYGGEEFAVLLPETDLEEGSIFAERIRENIEAIGSSVSGSPPSLDKVPITVSIGVASLPENAESPDELVFVADQLMYSAKKAGRNRVCIEVQ